LIDQLNGFYLRNQIGTNDDLKKNKDGSGTLYIQNESPGRDRESNWVQTISGKGWNIILRLYGPLQLWFNKTWRPGEIELIR
jgi:hypothetical protein